MAAWRCPPLPTQWAGTGHPALVGRQNDFAAIQQAWRQVGEGARQVVFVVGEPGAGKSRLVAEVATGLFRQGAAVLVGACIAEFGPPYQPFDEPLAHLAEAMQSGHFADQGAARTARSRRLERLLTLTRSGEVAGSEVGRDYQRELFDAAVAALRAAAAEQPLVLVLEDVHWAGETARQLLRYVVQRTAESPILILATYRTTAPERSTALVAALAELYRLDGVRRVVLEGLTSTDVTDYVCQQAGVSRERADAAAQFLCRQSGGNPFFLRELWRDLEMHGGLAAITRPRRAPDSVREMVEIRLSVLENPQRQALEIAAVIGESFDVATLLAAVGAPHESVLASLDQAVDLGLLQPVPSIDGDFGFPHALVRQSVIDLTPSSRRTTAHARVAAVLQALPETPLRIQRLAHHYALASALGHRDQAVRYLQKAGDQADRVLAHKDAAGFYERAVPHAVDAEQADLLRLAAARSHLLAADFSSARDLDELVATTGSPRNRLRAAIGYENASWRPGRPGHRAVELLSDALRAVDESLDDPLYVRALGSLGRALAFTGATDRASQFYNRAVRLARTLDDEKLLAHTLESGLQHPLRAQDAAPRLALATELTDLARRTGDVGHLGPASYYRGVVSYIQGDTDALDLAYEDMLRTAHTTGEDFWRFIAGCVTYSRRFVSGDFASAEETCTTLLELGGSFGSDDTEGPYGLQMYMIRRETGDLEQVRRLISGEEPVTGQWAPGLLALYTELGLVGPASRLLWMLLDGDLRRYQDSADWPAVAAFLVEATVALNDKAAAERLRPVLSEYAGLNLVAGPFVAVFGSADRYLGSLDSMLGRAGADLLFADALDMDVRMRAPVHQAQTLAAWGVHLFRHTRTQARAADVVERARLLCGEFGLTRVLRGLPTSMSPSRSRSAVGPTSGANDGLTSRELEVLALVTDGLSNRDISQRLFITENTTANHVRSILQKTGAVNRTQAARYAMTRALFPPP